MNNNKIILGSNFPAEVFARKTEAGIEIQGQYKWFWGYKINSGIQGDGAFIEWNFENERLELITDRYSIMPLYYYFDGSDLGFSYSVQNLVERYSSSDIDYQALSVFLRLGNYIGDSTAFCNIKRIRPFSSYVFDKNGLNIEQSKINVQVCQLDRDNAIKHYAKIFQNSIEKFARVATKNAVVPLSGGKDSRHILLSLLSAGFSPEFCITVDDISRKYEQEVFIARNICAQCGLKHIELINNISCFDAEIIKNELTGYSTFDHGFFVELREYLDSHSVDFIFDGLAGDVLSQSSFLNQTKTDYYISKKFNALANEILGDEGYYPKMLSSSVYAKISRENAIIALIEELQKYSDYPNPVSQFYFWNRTRRSISLNPILVLGHKKHVFFPYLDASVYDFLISLPVEYVLEKSFHTMAISYTFPEFDHIPYSSISIGKPISFMFVFKNMIKNLFLVFKIHKPNSVMKYNFFLLRS
ncbi:MAG: hypothetical protein V3574_03250, partial [Candidatus Moraniibacteriota bacterium]